MNKVSLVLGVAAVATLAGCKDPNYVRADKSQDEVKIAQTPVVEDREVVEQQPAVETVKEESKPKVEVVEEKAPDTKQVVEPETTVYIVQPGDYLAKISKKYNVKIAAIKSLNGLNSDIIKVGQKLKLPGKIDVGVQKQPVVSKKAQQKQQAKKPFKPYTGPTMEYVAVNGDYLGKIAAKHSITIRQLKELNNLTSDKVKIGQKFKVPAAAAKKDPVKKNVVEQESAVAPEVKPMPQDSAPVLDQVKPEDTPIPTGNPDGAVDAEEASPAAPVQPVQEETFTYVVQEGETINDICANWSVIPDTIKELNNLGDNDELKAGQVIKLPAAKKE